MITTSVTLFWLVLVLGICAIVIACLKEQPVTSTFFWMCAFWVTCLAFLWH